MYLFLIKRVIHYIYYLNIFLKTLLTNIHLNARMKQTENNCYSLTKYAIKASIILNTTIYILTVIIRIIHKYIAIIQSKIYK